MFKGRNGAPSVFALLVSDGPSCLAFCLLAVQDWSEYLVMGLSTSPLSGANLQLDTVAAHQLRDSWMVMAGGKAVSDVGNNQHLFVCPPLRRLKAGDSVALVVDALGQLSVHINGTPTPVTSPQAAAADAPGLALPVDDELYAFVSFPQTLRGTVEISGQAGTGLSLAAQTVQRRNRERAHQALACGRVHGYRLLFDGMA